MAGYILHEILDESITLTGPVVRRLIDAGDGDATLLYLCLMRARGATEPQRLRAELRWDELRFQDAERVLSELGLVSVPTAGIGAASEETALGPPPKQAHVPANAPVSQPPPNDAVIERPAEKQNIPEKRESDVPQYTREEVIERLENNKTFALLLKEVENKIGRLGDTSVRRLLVLYEYVALPAEVIYMLVSYCYERKAEQYGEGRAPSMREIEREGFLWAKHELFSAESANAFIKNEQAKRRSFPEYMAALSMGGRPIVPSEEKYLVKWLQMGFPPETVALAYDKTVMSIHEFKWSYCNAILRNWHDAGAHTAEEVGQMEASKKDSTGHVKKKYGRGARKNTSTKNEEENYDDEAWMDEFI